MQGHGYCRLHYDRWRRTGTTEVSPRRVLTPEQRFWPKVDKAGPIPPHRPELGPCWVWMASVFEDRNGYGKFQAGEGRATAEAVYAHRYAWELTWGTVPDGLWVLHHCDNPPCVRLDHLFLGTAADNVADMMAKGRHRTQRE